MCFQITRESSSFLATAVVLVQVVSDTGKNLKAFSFSQGVSVLL